MWTRSEADARARSGADYALLSTAPCRRGEVVWSHCGLGRKLLLALNRTLSTGPGRRREVAWTRTEAAVRARLDANYALLSTAPC